MRNQEMIAALCLRCVAAKMTLFFEDIKGNTPSNRAVGGPPWGARQSLAPGPRAAPRTLMTGPGARPGSSS